MKGRIAVAAAFCAVLVTGCASTVSGAGQRLSTDVPAASGSAAASGSTSAPVAPGSSQSGSSPSSAQPPSSTESGPGSSAIRPVPPLGASSGSTSDGSASGDANSGDTSSVAPGGDGSTPSSAQAPSTSTTPVQPQSSTTAGGSGSGGSTSTAADPATEFDGAASVDASTFPGSVTDVGFSSPSGNITCGIQAGTVVCQIDKYDYTPPKHDCGPSGWGFNFKLESTKSAFLFCAGDVESGGPALAYGKQITVGTVRCVSRQDGITCQNSSSGYGFRLSRSAYVFFGPNDVATTVGVSGAVAPAAIPPAVVGEWGGHGRELTISATGSGTLTYRTYQFCSDDPTPPCDKTQGNEIISGGHIAFVLTGPSATSAATGSVTSSNDPKTPVGTAVTATVKGYNLELSFWPGTPFCAANTPADKWNCGA